MRYTFLVLALLPLLAFAQDKVESSGLYNEIATADSLAFAAFNARDLKSYMNFYTEDVEFFHDQTGLTTPRDSLIADFKVLFRPERPTRVYRELIDSSLSVYPINHYGAVQMASHRLYEVAEDSVFRFEAIAKLYVIWKKINNAWKISRVVSYDHRPPTDKEELVNN